MLTLVATRGRDLISVIRGPVFAFRRYEDASLRYTGIDSLEGLTR